MCKQERWKFTACPHYECRRKVICLTASQLRKSCDVPAIQWCELPGQCLDCTESKKCEHCFYVFRGPAPTRPGERRCLCKNVRPSIVPRAMIAFNYEEWFDKYVLPNFGSNSKDMKEDARNAIDWKKENEEHDKCSKAIDSVLAINGGTIKSSQSAVHALLRKDSKRKAEQIQGWPSPKRKKIQDLYWKCSPLVLKDLNCPGEIKLADADPSQALPVGSLTQSLNLTIEDVTASMRERRSYATLPCTQVGVTGDAAVVSQSYGSGQQPWSASGPRSYQSNGIPPKRRRPHPLPKDLAHGMPKDLVNMQGQLSAAHMNMQVSPTSLSHLTGQSHHLPKQPRPH